LIHGAHGAPYRLSGYYSTYVERDLRQLSANHVECYFYRDNIGNEVDLIEADGSQVHAIEI
jgi:hypothetical protein